MKILVYGAGGVGGYFGARLAADGNDVIFAARGAHREAMAAEGLRVLSPLGDLHIERPVLLGDPAETGLCDVVLLCTKLWDLAAAAQSLAPMLAYDTAVIPLQNGIDGEEIVANAVGKERTVGGVAQIVAAIETPGTIRHNGKLARIVFGELNGEGSWRLEAFSAACVGAGIDHTLAEDIQREIWKKFVMLTPLAGATSYYRAPLGEILGDAERRAFHASLVQETAAVAAAKGISLPPDIAEKVIAGTAKLPESAKSSMLHDLEGGRRLELPWLNGAVVRLGGELGVETPSHQKVCDALTPFVNGA